MDGLAAVGDRIAQIQAQLASVLAPAPVRTAVRTAAGAAASTAPAAVAPADFATALQDAQRADATQASASGEPPVWSPAAGTSSAAPATGVPTELAAYGNGHVPAAALRTVGGSGHRLWAPAARALERLTVAAERAGVRVAITDSYRSYADQVDVAARKGLYSQGGLAAAPGTSDHGWGKSVDLRLDDRAQRWMRAHGAEYGFTENVAREPWHWTYQAR